MDKLPKILIILILTFQFLFLPVLTFAASPSPQASPTPSSVATPNPSGSVVVPSSDPSSEAIGVSNTDFSWQRDEEVTFAGKLVARSQDLLDWLLKNYEWADLSQSNPFSGLVQSISFVVYTILGLFVLAGAFLMIITRGRSMTIRRFIPRFILVLALVALSFSIVRTLYFVIDIFQGFFLKIDNKLITTHDLLSVAFDYADFIGFRRVGDTYNESAVISLLLVKLTAATYYTMFAILIIRKIILWFFILVSPIFPLLLFFKPIRNTAKIWVGEFFRWLLYAPLFAIFLRGLVEIWKDKSHIPLNFNYQGVGVPSAIEYPTAINILIGGPGQQIGGANTVNLPNTFALYLVSLLMLWMVIIMPWILLKIFLDYVQNMDGDNALVKFLARNRPNLPPSLGGGGGYRPQSPTSPGTPPSTPPPGSAGLAKSLPLSRFRHSPVAEIQQALQEQSEKQQAQVESAITATQQAAKSNIKSIGEATQSSVSSLQSTGQLFGQNFQVPTLETQQLNAQVLDLTNLSIPTMKDIAKFETALLTNQGPAKEQASKIAEALSRVGGLSQIVSPAEKEKFMAIRETITQASNKGSSVASSIEAAANPVAGASLPETNKVQQVSLDDYEEVKNTWHENYNKLEPPAGPDGKPMERSEWLKQEVSKIPQVIDLLLSGDPGKVEQGKQMVSKILPFLLLGGFSKTEIIAYLKAKLEAAKAALKETIAEDMKKAEADTLVERSENKPEEKSMTLEAQVPEDEPPKTNLTGGGNQESQSTNQEEDKTPAPDKTKDKDVVL